ncbi:DUF2247 family protein [Listeria monocytogenes]|nr:DUF2247 family protein [Listeria monocytogenes]
MTEQRYRNPLYNDFDFLKINEFIEAWTWQELATGLKYSIISRDDIVEYANKILGDKTLNFETVLELAIVNPLEDIIPILKKLLSFEEIQSEDYIMDKWRFAMLLQLYINKGKYDNVYVQIAEISADFNEPKDMYAFIHYRPVTSLDMMASWQDYLIKQCARFHINYNFS